MLHVRIASLGLVGFGSAVYYGFRVLRGPRGTRTYGSRAYAGFRAYRFGVFLDGSL